VQADSTEHLMELLKVASGGIVFTTIQKFFPDKSNGNEGRFPTLSERKNIIVIADEAHRSQYGFEAKVITKKKNRISFTALPSIYGMPCLMPHSLVLQEHRLNLLTGTQEKYSVITLIFTT